MKPALALLLFLAAAAQAEAPAPGPFPAMRDEIKRTVSRLDMNGLGKPYYVNFTVLDNYRLEIEGFFGAVKDPNISRIRDIKVGLRVGNRQFDQSHYVGRDYWRYRPFIDDAPYEEDYDALRYNFWQLADAAYKYSLEKLSQKKAYKRARNMEDEKVGDLSQEPPTVVRESFQTAPFDVPSWENTIRKVSGVFRGFPEIEASSANLYWTERQQYFVDSEGRESAKPADDFELTITAGAQASDGLPVSDRRRVIRQKLSEMPSLPNLQALAAQTAADVTSLAKAPLMDTYIGPVLLEGQASGEFFNQLLAHNLSFSRSLWIEDERLKENYATGELADRLGFRVVSPLLSVMDDPTLTSYEGQPLIGHYELDDESIPGQKVGLIEKGFLKDILMGRAPIQERSRSNGHGRASFPEYPTARISSLIIKAEKTMAPAELKAELLARAKDYGLAYGLIIRRLGEEDTQEKDEILAEPVLVYRVYVSDGREELVRNARFSGVTLRALRDVVAASDKNYVYNYYQLGPDKMNRGQTQASIICPSVIVSEMELRKTEKKPEKRPYLKHPFFAER